MVQRRLTGLDLPSLALAPEAPLKRAIEEYMKMRPGLFAGNTI